MLILYLAFITISTIHCAGISDPDVLVASDIFHFTGEDGGATVYCGHQIDIPRTYLNYYKVFHFKNCSKSVLPLFGPRYSGWSRPEDQITIKVSNLGWKSLDSDSFLGYYSKNLWKLIANHNELKALPDGVFAGAKKFKYLDVSYNQFENIESFGEAGLVALETLLISHNNIVAIGETTFRNCNHLKKLDLSSNNLATTADGTFDLIPNLEKLSMAYNSFFHLDFGTFTSLKSLELIDISNNRLHSVDFRVHVPVFRHLEHLNMESNQISAAYGLDASTFPYLSYLSLRNNSFDCNKLQDILGTFNLKEMDIAMDPSKQVKFGYAFRGIACQPPQGNILDND